MPEIIYTNKKNILTTVKEICQNTLKPTDIAVDMTIGNGNDTLFLATIVKQGIIFGFDIQQEAIQNTTQLLDQNKITNYQLFLESHEQIDKRVSFYQGKIKLILFNLGYLPKANKTIMTNHVSTLNALVNSKKMLDKNGKILIVCYPHEEGKLEALTIKDYLQNQNIFYKEYHNTNNINAPFLIEITSS